MSRDFVDYVVELMAPLGPVTARKMFGGYGLYHDGLMFALIGDETLYIKADDANRDKFIAAGSEPFLYHKKGKQYSMSYYRAPAEALDDTDAMYEWARLGYDAAVRAAR